jgi:hypothetical protein
MKPLHLGYDANGKSLQLKPEDRKAHMHVIGSSGSGKSKFLEWLIRGDLRNRQGFALLDPHGTLYHDVMHYCAHHVLDREIIPLDLSNPGAVIGFNPFQRAAEGDVSVQVDRRITATMHAWDTPNTDQTPTLARTLRLIFTVMLEANLGLPQVAHLIDFNSGDIRSHLIDKLTTPLVKKEWRELQSLRAKEWRDETLSAKNRLFKFLTSPTLGRFMGVPGRSLDLKAIMDEALGGCPAACGGCWTRASRRTSPSRWTCGASSPRWRASGVPPREFRMALRSEPQASGAHMEMPWNQPPPRPLCARRAERTWRSMR